MTESLRGRIPRPIISIVIAALLLAIGKPAAAQPFGSNQPDPCDDTIASQCVANNEFHYVYFYQVETPQRDALLWAMLNEYNSSDTDVWWAEVSSDETADVIVKDIDVQDNGNVAWTTCGQGATYGGSGANHTRWCQPQVIKFNLRFNIPPSQTGDGRYGWGTTYLRRWVACHEFGHTLGLRHQAHSTTPESCMEPIDNPSPANPSGDGNTNTLTTHELNHLINYYP